MQPSTLAADSALPTFTWITVTAWAALGALLLLAVITDLRHRQIPNRLVAAGALSAVLQQVFLPMGQHPAMAPHYGTPGLLAGTVAAALMLLMAGLLWRVGLWGAGDAKWLTVLAAHSAPSQVMPLLLFTLMAGGVLALHWRATRRPNPMPYALAIAGGELALVAAARLEAPSG